MMSHGAWAHVIALAINMKRPSSRKANARDLVHLLHCRIESLDKKAFEEHDDSLTNAMWFVR